MKKRFFWLLFFTLFVITCFSFSACTEVADLGINDPSAADPDSGKDKNSVCTTHIDTDKNKKCDKCGVDFIGDCATHKDSDDDHKCDYCAFVIGECRDENIDGICDACGKILRDNSTPPCVDSNKDGACDDCGKKIDCVECIDRDKNGACDNCGGRVECAECIDENYNGRCDVCSAKVEIKPHDCKDENEDYVCDLCEKKLSCQTLCIDENLDGVCDICKTDNHAIKCIDANYNGICEICLATVEIKERPDCDECIDENFDDWCDNCGALFIEKERSFSNIIPKLYTDENILNFKKKPTDPEFITDVDSMKFARYQYDYETDSLVLRETHAFSEYQRAMVGFWEEFVILVSENYFCCALLYNEKVYSPSVILEDYPQLSISETLEMVDFGVFTAEDVEEIFPDGIYPYHSSSLGFARTNYSHHWTEEGCRVTLIYNPETRILEGYIISKLECKQFEKTVCDECIDENFDDWCDNCGLTIYQTGNR